VQPPKTSARTTGLRTLRGIEPLRLSQLAQLYTQSKKPAKPKPRGFLSTHEPRNQIRLNTNVPLVPPNPNPFDTATSIFFSRATFGT